MEAQKDPAQVSTDRYKRQQIQLIYDSLGHESTSPPSDLHRGVAMLLSFTDSDLHRGIATLLSFTDSDLHRGIATLLSFTDSDLHRGIATLLSFTDSDLHRGIATLLSFTDNAGAQDLGGSAALLTSLPLKELAFGKTGSGQHAELEGI